MQFLGLPSLLISTALAAGPTAGPTAVPTTRAPSKVSSTELELEVVERSGGTSSSFGFVVPVDGKVEAFIDRDGDSQRCELEVHPIRASLRVKLRCDGKPAHALQVEATRALATGTRIRLAEVSRPGGATSQVFVTLR